MTGKNTPNEKGQLQFYCFDMCQNMCVSKTVEFLSRGFSWQLKKELNVQNKTAYTNPVTRLTISQRTALDLFSGSRRFHTDVKCIK